MQAVRQGRPGGMLTHSNAPIHNRLPDRKTPHEGSSNRTLPHQQDNAYQIAEPSCGY